MKPDPIIEEIHELRRNHAGQFNYDLRAMFAALKEEERASGRKLVSRQPRHKSVPLGKQIDLPRGKRNDANVINNQTARRHICNQ